MQINLKQLETSASGEERFLDFEYDLDLSEVIQWGVHPFIQPVKVMGRALSYLGMLSVKYRASYVKEDQCSRCLTPVKASNEAAFEHMLLECGDGGDGPLDMDDGYIPVRNGMLDVDELVSADVVLSLEQTTLCKPDCLGLCPRCGVNLNTQACSCSTNEPDSRFAALLALMEEQ